MLDGLRKEVLRVSRLAESSGLCQHGSGNFSMVDRKEVLVAITPHAESRYSITEEDILVIDLEGNIVENPNRRKPTSEMVVHLEVLNNRADVNAVCHTHARNASVFAAMNKEIKPVLCEALFYGGYCRVAPFENPGSIELARSVVKALEGSKAALMQHHGLVTVGKDVYDAYRNSIYVEEVAAVCLAAASVVGYDNLDYLSEEQVDYLMHVLKIVG
jgi:L-ribulose-5-phosphate 4-epimerase